MCKLETPGYVEDNTDFFAANLLLSSKLITRYVMNNSGLGRTELVKRICSIFSVDKDTVDKRFIELGLEI